MPHYRAVTPPTIDQILAIRDECKVSTFEAQRLAIKAQCVEALDKAQTVDDLRPILFTLLSHVFHV